MRSADLFALGSLNSPASFKNFRSRRLPPRRHPINRIGSKQRSRAKDERGSRAAFSQLFDEIQEHLQREDYAALADMLSRLADAADKLDPVLSTAGLRLTSMARSSIPNWLSSRDTIARALEAAGHDPKSVLIGLYDG